jgi:hypothetical protein
MTIELPADVEEQLRALAAREGRGLDAVVEDALRIYLEAAAITDLDAAEVGEGKMDLLKQAPFDYTEWRADLWSDVSVERLSSDAMQALGSPARCRQDGE